MKVTWLTISELAAALKVSVKTVRRAYLTGEIPSERISRFVRFDVEQVKEAMRKYVSTLPVDSRVVGLNEAKTGAS